MPRISRRRFLNASLAAGMTAAAASSLRSNGLPTPWGQNTQPTCNLAENQDVNARQLDESRTT